MEPTAALTAQERLAQVQAQAKQEVGDQADLARDEQIAEVSHLGSLGAGAALALKGGWVGLAAFSAGVGGGKAGAWLADQVGAADFVADKLEAMGMRRIGSGGPHPAAKGHQVAHSYAFAGMLAAIAVGVVAAVAVGVAIVATGGAAAVAIIGAAAAGGFAGGFFGSALGGALSQMGSRTGPIIEGSPDVFIEGKPAARMTDKAACGKESAPQPIIEGSETIFVNGLPLARLGHQLLCGAKIDQGANSVFMDQTTAACAQPAPDIPLGARIAADWLGFLPLGKFAATLGRNSRPAKTVSTHKGGGNCLKNTTCAKDPVNVATGEFVDWRTDLHIPGVLPVELRRHYASRREAREGAPAGLFGPRWLDSWSVSLRRRSSGGALIDYLDDEGVIYTFDTPYEQLEAEHLCAPHLVLRGTREQPVLHDRERGVRLHFEWRGSTARLAGYSDASGNHCEFVYEAASEAGAERIAMLRHSDGWRLALQWASATGCLHSAWLHEPDRAPVELVRYRHDEQGRLIHSASQASGRLRYRYDAQHRIVGWGDDSDTQVRIVYDDEGRVGEVQTPGDLHSGRFRYDPAQGITQVWDADPSLPVEQREALCTAYYYNADGLVTCERDALGHETHTEWDRHQRVVSRTDALGRRTRYLHDDAGHVAEVIDPQGRRARFEHDEEGRLLRMTDASGRQLQCSYDEAGRLAAQAGSDDRRYEYDARGRLRAEHGPQGCIAQYHYDERHRPCGHTAANGAHTAWRQDRLGRIDWETDPAGATTTYEYESGGSPDAPLPEGPRAHAHVQPIAIVAPDSGVTRLRYDREGLLCEQTDPHGHQQHWRWGAFDLLAAHTDAQGHATQYRYGRDARLSELVNAAGQRWRWRYDAAGRMAEQIDYAGRRTRWQHNAMGRPLLRTAPDGQTLRYQWDEADRVRAIHATDGTRITYAYDERDQLVQARVWRCGQESSTLESELHLAYDAQGRLVEENHRGEHGAPRRIAYRYDEQGRLTGRSGPLGEARYEHDALGLLKELHTAHGAVHIQRDLLGRETERASLAPQPQAPAAPHFRLQQRFDKLGRLVHQRAAAPHGLADSVSRRYHWQHERLLGVDDGRFGSVRWQLDAREQIREARYDSAHESLADAARLAEHPRILDGGAARPHAGHSREHYGYDALGNLSSQGGESVQLRYSADTVVEHGPLRYEWDACGRLAARTETRPGFRPRTWRYEWDGFDRLKRVTTPEGQRWRYVYDAFGRRRAKRCEHGAPQPGGHRPRLRQAEYLWDGAALAAQWKVYADGSSEAPLQEEVQEWHFEPGGFTPLALVQQRHGQTQLLHVVSDLNGAPRELIGNDGELVWAAQLGTWGQLSRCHVKDRDRAYAARFAPGYRAAANDPLVDVDLRFANQWEDEESKLFYNLNRYYDPAVGQYASQDPLGPAGGIRTHGYVHNPMTWVDPLGLNGCVTGAIKSIDQQLAGGKGASVKVESKGHAEEALRYYTTGRNQPGAWKDTTHTAYDMRGSQWLPDGVNRGPKGRYGTYHWDEYNPAAARGDHASEGSHLQLHTWEGKVVRVFYD